MKNDKKITIAYFVSSHGFGHAARSSAVIQAVIEQIQGAEIHIFSGTPEWFFQESIDGNFTYYLEDTDVGLIQSTPFEENLEKTLCQLDLLYPIRNEQQCRISEIFEKINPDLVISDISPIGILAAKENNITTLLIENFTWDWIYESFLVESEGFQKQIDYLRDTLNFADFHVKTIPYCDERLSPDLITFPVSRKPRQKRKDVRNSLGITTDQKMVLVSMGGIPERFKFIENLKEYSDVIFVIPGGSEDGIERGENWICFPHHSDFYHPDLVNASDVLLGKAGYSTIAEVYQAGISFGYFSRERFREAEILQKYIENELKGIEFRWRDFESDIWKGKLAKLLEQSASEKLEGNGSLQIADFIQKISLDCQ